MTDDLDITPREEVDAKSRLLCHEAGIEAWVWLLVKALNYEFCAEGRIPPERRLSAEPLLREAKRIALDKLRETVAWTSSFVVAISITWGRPCARRSLCPGNR